MAKGKLEENIRKYIKKIIFITKEDFLKITKKKIYTTKQKNGPRI